MSRSLFSSAGRSATLVAFVERAPRGMIWVTVVLGIGLVGIVDLVTGTQLSFSIFYLAPTGLGAWRLGRSAGLGVSGLAAATWLAADLARNDSYYHAVIPYWNAGVRFAFFAIVAMLLDRVHGALVAERQLAATDSVTGLVNARGFTAALNRTVELARRYGRPFTLAYIDLDDFKSVNDRYGHPAGDMVLRGIASELGASLRAVDVVARIGGDEFAVIMPETGHEAAVAALQKVGTQLASVVGPGGAGVGASIGALTCDLAPLDSADLLRQADALMYRAKTGGKGRIEIGRYIAPEVPTPAR